MTLHQDDIEAARRTANEIADWLDMQWLDAKDAKLLRIIAKLIREKYAEVAKA